MYTFFRHSFIYFILIYFTFTWTIYKQFTHLKYKFAEVKLSILPPDSILIRFVILVYRNLETVCCVWKKKQNKTVKEII